MKVVITILLICIALPASAQFTAPRDTTYPFTHEEMINGVRRVQKLERKSELCDSLAENYRAQSHTFFLQIADLKDELKNKDQIIRLAADEILLYQKNDSLYRLAMESTRPKWYDAKLLWFGLGVLAVAGGRLLLK